MAKRRCRRCPTLVPVDAYKGMCDQCRRDWDKARGSRTERGYGAEHIAERARIQDDMNHGKQFTCARCHKPIQPGQPWVPDHNDQRTGYIGASHELCNNRAAGIASHRT